MKSKKIETLISNQPTTDEVFDDAACAKYLHTKSRTLRLWRRTRGLPHVKITSRVIRYRKADIDEWMRRQTVSLMA
jgi:hypothetical protein